MVARAWRTSFETTRPISAAVRAEIPRNPCGNVMIYFWIGHDDTMVSVEWNEVDSHGFMLRHPDAEYLATMVRNRLEQPEYEFLKAHLRPDMHRSH
jgi:hypothetical protein